MANELNDLIESTGRAVAGASGHGRRRGRRCCRCPYRQQGATQGGPGDRGEPLREHYAAEPYYDATYAFEDYLPAWRTGWEGIGKYPGKSFEQAERDLQSDFHWNRGQSRLLWDQAKAAVRAGFER